MATAALALFDGSQTSGRIDADGRWDARWFEDFGRYRPRLDARLARPGSRVTIRGLGADAPLTVTLGVAAFGLAAGGPPRDLRIEADTRDAAWLAAPASEDLGGVAHKRVWPLRFASHGDASGRLTLRFPGLAPSDGLAITGIRIAHDARPRLLWMRLCAYALLAGLTGALGRWAAGRAGAALGFACAVAFGFWVSQARLFALSFLPALLAVAASSLGCALCTRLLSVDGRAARVVVAAFALRLGLVIQPAFPCIDLGFHSGTLAAFRAGERIESRAPNPDRHQPALAVPYPPALYALLSPFAALGVDRETLVRASLGLLEGSAPLLVFALARAGGLSPLAASAASATAAAMPEGMLVLGKGIAANALGSWTALAALWALLARRSALTMAVLLALAGLAHFGHAILLGALLAAWLAHAAPRGLVARREALAIAACVVAAALVAWLAYYREVFDLARSAGAALGRDSSEPFWRLRLVQLGKTAQDLLLKFGGLPVALAVAGLRRGGASAVLRGLLLPWVAVGVAAGAAAMWTPVPLRFEYFLVPAVALAAGLALEPRLVGAARGVQGVWFATLALQAACGALLLFDRFNLISVIMESGRWPFPVRF